MRAGAAVFLIGLMTMVFDPGQAGASQAMIDVESWQAYKQQFLDVSGRIVDNANRNISHSESQGYGLLLAYLSASPADFEQIWSFTRTELLVRDDGLAAWSWDPAASPHVVDINNATDGDLLIAYALALAGRDWSRQDYARAAAKIAQAVLDKAVLQKDGRTLLLPGAQGFSAADRKDGPVVNPSYCVFEAFDVLNTLVPSPAWKQISDGCLALLKQAQFGPRRLPAEWVSLKDAPVPADGFAPEFGYNAIRIPLYLIRGGLDDREMLGRLRAGMADASGAITLIDLPSGNVKAVLDDPGYRIINDLMNCVLDGTKIPAVDRQFGARLYYPSTLQLLGLAYVAEKRPECL